MDVDASLGGDVQHPLGQDSAVGHHRDHVGGKAFQLFIKRAVFESLGLVDRQTLLHRIDLDGRGLKLIASALGLIGLSDHKGNLMPGLHQCL